LAKKILLIFILFICSPVILYASQSDLPGIPANFFGPVIGTSTDVLEFGTVSLGDSLSLNFTIYNNGDASLDIDSIGTPGAFTAIPGSVSGIAPGDSALITVTFHPPADTLYTDYLIIYCSDPVTPVKSVILQGAVISPCLVLYPMSIDFDSIGVGSTGLSRITVRNDGSDTLNVPHITTRSPIFSLSDITLSDIYPGDSTDITVWFTPLDQITYNDTVIFESNDTVNPSDSVFVQGKGTTGVAAISANTVSLEFDTLFVGKADTLKVVIYSEGTGKLNILNIRTIDGFSVFPQDITSIMPGDSAEFSVVFEPAADSVYSGNIIFESNAAVDHDVVVSVLGVALSSASIDVSPNSLDFGSVFVGNLSVKQISVRNNGTGNLHISNITKPTGFSVTPGFISNIVPGDSAQVTVMFKPTDVKSYNDSIIITSNDPINDNLRIPVQGIGRSLSPVITISHDSLDFGSIAVGYSKDLTVSVYNDGFEELTVSDISSSPVFMPSDTMLGSIPQSSSVELKIRFTPLSDSIYVDTLYFLSNDPVTPSKALVVFGAGKLDDQAPVIISGPSAFVSDTSTAVIAWETDEPATSKVMFSPGATLSESPTIVIDTNMSVSHNVVLPSLSKNTMYAYKVVSADMEGNEVTSVVQNFQTPVVPIYDPPVIVVQPEVTGIDDDEAIIAIETQEPSFIIVYYNIDSLFANDSYLTVEDSTVVMQHSVRLTGLLPGKSYSLFTRVYETNGKAAVRSSTVGFITNSAPDNDPPVILGPPRHYVYDTSAVLTQWTTDEGASGSVFYRDKDEQGDYTVRSIEKLRTEHSITISGLSPGTEYEYYVSSTDAFGNGPSYSSIHTFSMLSVNDILPPVFVTAPHVESIDTDRVTITWETNEVSSSLIAYAKSSCWPDSVSSVGDNSLVTEHRINITGLDSNTDYMYRAESSDASGNDPVYNRILEFTTLENADMNPPVLAGLPDAVSVGPGSAIIEWATNEASNSIVEWAEDSLWDNGSHHIKTVQSLVKVHKIGITGLNAGILYRFRTGSADVNGNGPVYSPEQTFVTPDSNDTLPPVMLGFPSAVDIDTGNVTIIWDTDESSTSIVYITEKDGIETRKIEDNRLIKEHAVIIDGLRPAATYSVQVASSDAWGNGPEYNRHIIDFTTLSQSSTRLPEFTGLPEIMVIDSSVVEITVMTDIESDMQVTYAAAEDFSNSVSHSVVYSPEYVKKHSVLLTDLSPDTEYLFILLVTERNGSQSTESDVYNFRTSSLSDKKPPVIVGYPVITPGDSTSVNITFNTDEPSNTVVQFRHKGEDQKFRILNDSKLVKLHDVYIVNLIPDTIYEGFVQTRDVAGNGPAESGLFTFSTRTITDIYVPKVIGLPEILNADTASAVIRYFTDEKSTTLVKYFAIESTTDTLIYRDNDLVKDHNVFITHLQKNTEYGFFIGSTDVNGNSVICKDAFSFKTLNEPDNKAPVLLGSPVAQDAGFENVTIIWRTDEPSNSRVDIREVSDSTSKATIFDGNQVTDHSVFISGLRAGTEYEYRVSSTDFKNNSPVVSAYHRLTTSEDVDTSRPRILSGPTISDITHNSAVVKIVTSETVFTTVHYGVDTSAANELTRLEGETLHQFQLTNLEDSTRYYYRITGKDITGNEFIYPGEGIELPYFNTEPAASFEDTTSPVIIEGPVETEIETDRVVIYWKTDKLSNSIISYGLDESVELTKSGDNSRLVFEHEIELTNLQADTTYYYSVESYGKNNRHVTSSVFSIKTAVSSDTLPPVITEGPIALFTGHDNALIEWRTNRNASSEVRAGLDSIVMDITVKTDEIRNVKLHRVHLNNLEANSVYYYKVYSTAGNEQTGESGIFSFMTPVMPDSVKPNIVQGPDLTLNEPDKIVIEWITDEPSDSKVEFGRNSDVNTWNNIRTIWVDADAGGVTRHKAVLTGLISANEYVFRVISTDISSNRNRTVSRKKSFTTDSIADTNAPQLISRPIIRKRNNMALFAWSTDEPSDSHVLVRIKGTGADFFKTSNPVKTTNHVIKVHNLFPGQLYEFEIVSRDMSGNLLTWPTQTDADNLDKFAALRKSLFVNLPDGNFFTDANADTRMPVFIEGPSIAARTSSSLTVIWKTDEYSDSFIEYGRDSTYGCTITNAEDVELHKIVIHNLDASTQYNMRIGSVDMCNNGPVYSPNITAMTLSGNDESPPKIISGPEVGSLSDNRAVIVWETDELSDSQVEFGFAEGIYLFNRLNPEDVKLHALTLTNLKRATKYHYRIQSTDVSDNGPTSSGDFTFTTPNVSDEAPPDISDISVSAISDERARITYNTDELGDTYIEYGKSEAEVLSPAGPARELEQIVTDHTITLTNLDPNTLYYFRVGSNDNSGNESVSSISSFRTAMESDSVPPEAPSGLSGVPGSERVLLRWNYSNETNIDGYNIYYSILDDYSLIESLVNDTTYIVENLSDNTAYEFRVTAVDIANPSNESAPSGTVKVTPQEYFDPQVPAPFYPVDRNIIRNDKINLQVVSVNAPPGRENLTYEFVIAKESDFFNQVAYVDGIEGTNSTITWESGLVLEHNREYYWKARAFDGYFYSDWSPTASFIADTTVVTGINLINFTGIDFEGNVHLAWEISENKENSGFNVYRSLSKDGNYVKLNELLITGSNNDFSYIDDKAITGKTYCYKLESVDLRGIRYQLGEIEISVATPDKFKLYQNYPNPFNASTTIKFDLPFPGKTVIAVYNILGQEVCVLLNHDMSAGYHKISWDGRNNHGRLVSSGLYIFRIKTSGFTASRKMLMIK